MHTESKFPCDSQCKSMSSWPGEDAGLAVGNSMAPGSAQLGPWALQGPRQSPSVAAVPGQMLLRTRVTLQLPEKGGAISLGRRNPKGRNNASCIYCGPETDKNVVFSPPLAFRWWFFSMVFLNIWENVLKTRVV